MAGSTTKSENTSGLPSGTRLQTVIQYNLAVADLETLRQNDLSCVTSTAGLAISGAGSPTAKAANAIRAVVLPAGGGTLLYVFKAANTSMAALAGTVTNAQFGMFWFSVDSTGTLKTYFSGSAATRAAMLFPSIPASEAVIGYVEINPTGTGNFVGGTTNLDDGTVVPNAVYVNVTGSPVLGSTKTAAGLTAAKIGNMSGTVITA